MQFNLNRFRTFPEFLKFTTLLTTVLVMLSLGAAVVEPPGTAFVWITTVLAIVADCMSILALGFELEGVLFKPGSLLGWPMLECVLSAFFAINYFISIWLCVNSKVFAVLSTANISTTSYALAATFCLVAFVQYLLNLFAYVRLWMAEQRKAANEIHPSQLGYANYGAP